MGALVQDSGMMKTTDRRTRLEIASDPSRSRHWAICFLYRRTLRVPPTRLLPELKGLMREKTASENKSPYSHG